MESSNTGSYARENHDVTSSLKQDGDSRGDGLPIIDDSEGHTPDRRLPFIVLFAMKVASVFYHSDVTGDRRCYSCRMCAGRCSGNAPEGNRWTRLITGNDSDIHADPVCQWYQDRDRAMSNYEKLCQMRDEKREGGCACSLCDSFWWNYDGSIERYDDRSIGIAPGWNHSGSWFISFAIMSSAFVFLVWDFLFYMNDIWWDPKQAIHVFNYAEFILVLALYPVCNLCSKIVSASWDDRRPSGLSWTTAINARFILKRLQFIGFRRKGIPGKALFAVVFFLPPLIAFSRGYTYVSLSGHFTRHSGLSVVCCGVIMWIQAIFLYLVYLMRLSFHRHFHLITEYIISHPRDFGDCRRILGNAIQDFNCFRGFVSRYMFVNTPVLTWSITTQVVWLYIVLDELCPDQDHTRVREVILRVALLSWTVILFSMTVLLWSIGGLDVAYITDDFKTRTLMTMGLVGFSKTCERLLVFCDDVTQDPRYGVNATTFFSAISFFMALNLDQSQSVNYFVEITCNQTSLTPVTAA